MSPNPSDYQKVLWVEMGNGNDLIEIKVQEMIFNEIGQYMK